MNAIEIAAMLDKIKDSGGTVELIDGKPVARNVPSNFLPLLKTNREAVIRMLSNRNVRPIGQRTCKECRNGNSQYHYACLEAFKAGLVEEDRFQIAWHDRGGIGCKHFDEI